MVTATEKKGAVTMHGRLFVIARFVFNAGEALWDNEVTGMMQETGANVEWLCELESKTIMSMA